MKLKVGDRVRFLNDVGGGVVKRIIDKKTVLVEYDHGFEVPVAESEVLLVDNYGDSKLVSSLPVEASDNEKLKPEPIGIALKTHDIEVENRNAEKIDFFEMNRGYDEPGDLLGLFIAFVPIDSLNPTDSDQTLYLINDSSYRLLYVVSKWESNGHLMPYKAGFLAPDTKEIIVELTKNDLNNEISLNIQVLYFKNTSYKPYQPEFFDFSVHPSKFYKRGSFIENEFFDEQAMVFSIADSKKEELLKTLSDRAIISSIKSKDALIVKPNTDKNFNETIEVDLHIHELVENIAYLTPTEILDIQLARFKVSLETAINSKTKKIIFIHGVGNGKLKQELRKELDKSYPRLRYQDASFREYGYGATMVFIR